MATETIVEVDPSSGALNRASSLLPQIAAGLPCFGSRLPSCSEAQEALIALWTREDDDDPDGGQTCADSYYGEHNFSIVNVAERNGDRFEEIDRKEEHSRG